MNRLTVHTIQCAIAAYYGITLNDLKGAKRTKRFARPRLVSYAACKMLTDYALSEIGRLHGGRDHSTVQKGIESVTRRNNPDEQALLEALHRPDAITAILQPTKAKVGTWWPAFRHTVTIKYAA